MLQVRNEALSDPMVAFVQLDVTLPPLSTLISGHTRDLRGEEGLFHILYFLHLDLKKKIFIVYWREGKISFLRKIANPLCGSKTKLSRLQDTNLFLFY